MPRERQIEKGVSPSDYLQAQVEFWMTYHNHKEQMAFAGTGLLLTGSVALSFLNLPQLSHSQAANWLALFLLTIVTALAGIVFVNWELQLRETAAGMLRACGVLIAKWVNSPPKKEDLEFAFNTEGRPMTAALLETYEEVKETYTWYKDPRFIRLVTLVVLVLWAAVAVGHVLFLGFDSGAIQSLLACE